MSQQSRQEAAKRYLLGTLSDEERDQLEQRYFSDTPEFDEIEIAEDDLVDAYVRNNLTAAERQRFETVASSSPHLLERVEFAKLLSQKTTASPSPAKEEEVPKPGRWRRLFAFDPPARLAFGFGVLLVLLGGLLVFGAWLQVRRTSDAIAAREATLEQRRQEIERLAAQTKASNEQRASELQAQEAQLKAQQQATQEVIREPNQSTLGFVQTLFLRAGTTRGGGGNSDLALRQNTSRIRFNIDVTGSDSRRYRATIFDPDLKAVSRPRIVTPRKTGSGDFLIFEIPAKGLSPGDYSVRVEGLTATGEVENNNDYPFRLTQAR